MLDGVDLLGLSDSEIRDIRGDDIESESRIPRRQSNRGDPQRLIVDEMGKAERKDRVVELLSLVGIPSLDQRVGSYP